MSDSEIDAVPLDQDAETWLPQEVWRQARPYIVCILTDLVISTVLWLCLWAFKKLTSSAPIDGWAGEFLRNVHSAGTVITLAIFVALLISDIYTLHVKRHRE